ncbi:MAG: ComEC family competence protein [Emcibacter sp.]|nr:ComEC family competence protein [Emcibacter sp.]
MEEVLYQEYDRLILWSPVLFAVGIGLYFSLAIEPPLYMATTVCIVLLLSFILFRRYFLMRIMFIIMVIVTSGFLSANIRTYFLATPVLGKNLLPRMITGLVTDVRHYNDGKLHIILENPNFYNEIKGSRPLNKIRLKVHKYDDLPYPGDKIKIRAGLMPLPSPAMPNDFDYARQIWFQGIGALGYAISKPEILEKGPKAIGLGTHQRQIISENIRNIIQGDAGGLASALITGMREGISQDVADNMRNSGLAHLLAISGLHMGLLCGAAFFFSRFLLSRSEFLTLRYPIKKWAALIAIGAGIIYVYMSGGSVPTVRAFIMACILFLGILTDRKAISLRLVAIAAMIILILTPEVLLSVSFQMSFAAVVALIAAYEKITERNGFLSGSYTKNNGNKNSGWIKKTGYYIATILLTTLIAELAIAPFALFHFNKLVQYGLLANLLAMPIMASFVMPCVVVYLILAPIGLGFLALYPMSYGLEAIMFVAKTISHAPGSYSLIPAYGIASLIIMVMGGLWFIIWRLPWKNIGIVVVILGFLSAFFTSKPDIVIDNKGRLIGVKNANEEISLSSLRAGRMTRERWAQHFGQKTIEKWSYNEENTDGDSWMTCDALSCLYRPLQTQSEILIALVKDEMALTEDCINAEIVISLVPVEVPCPSATLVIDKWDFYNKGGYALWLPHNTGDVIRVETVVDSRGNRPWSRGQ